MTLLRCHFIQMLKINQSMYIWMFVMHIQMQ